MTAGSADAAGERRPRLAVFGFDAAEAAQIRRMRSYMDCGFDVTGYMMRRSNMNPDFEPFWDNVHLYHTENESILKRCGVILGSILKLCAHRKKLADSDVIVARNLDMLAIAVVGRACLRQRPPLIYECLDIHGLMTDPGIKGRIARFAERRLLGSTTALIVSSPAFVREYFGPVQNWNGPVVLLENKVWIEAGDPPRPTPPPPEDDTRWTEERPLRLSWVGTLRCAASLSILAETADRMGKRVHVALHGVVHKHAIPDFHDIVAARPNMHWHGPYDYPEGLEEIYDQSDLVWSQDLWQWGTNSTWLLPNRIYEASYFGCPSIAVDGSETGVRVADGLGWTIPEPTPDALCTLLERLSPAQVTDARRALLARPESDFRQLPQEIAGAIRIATDEFTPRAVAPVHNT